MKFTNEYKSTRSGFSHTSTLWSDNEELVSVAVCKYMNRTWESYAFQSSMKSAVNQAIENQVQKEKQLQGITRLTKSKRLEIENYSSIINELKTLYKTL
jgi:hypothetical protein